MAGPAFKLLNASPIGLINLNNGFASATGDNVILGCVVSNPGTTSLVISAVSVVVTSGNPGDFALSGFVGPQTIVAGGAATVCTIEFVPTVGLNVMETATLTFTSNAVSGIQVYTLQCTNVNIPMAYINYTGSLFHTFIPSADFGNMAVGASQTIVINVTNPDPLGGDPNVTVTATADVAHNFTITPASQSIPSLGTMSFTLNLTAALAGGLHDYPAAVSFSDGTNTFTFEVFYQTVALVPAFTLVGDQEITGVALRTSSSSSLINDFDPTEQCEDTAFITRQYYIDQPHLNKNVNRVWMFYERLGVFTTQAGLSTVNPSNTPNSVANYTAPSALTDEVLQIAVFDVQITGSMITLALVSQANSGTLSIVGFMFKVDEGGEVIENT